MAHTTQNSQLLIVQEVWKEDIETSFEDALMAQLFVRTLPESDFPAGETFVIPSIGEAQVYDYNEDSELEYRTRDKGQTNFAITEYPASSEYITNKMAQDSHYMNALTSTFAPGQLRAVLKHFESFVFATADRAYNGSNDSRVINGDPHRFAGSGVGGTFDINDVAYAKKSLDSALVPQTGRVAIVHDAVELSLNLKIGANITAPAWQEMVQAGYANGVRFIRQIFGFDIYISNFLPEVTDTALDTYDGTATVNMTTQKGKACLFYSIEDTANPLLALWRQKPTLESKYNMDRQRTEYATIGRYGVGLIKPEFLVMVACSTIVRVA